MREHRVYVQIPGSQTHELPPLLVRSGAPAAPFDDVLDHAAVIVESEDILPATGEDADVIEHRKLDLAIRLVDEYRRLVAHWQWGDSILAWIRQCEITFEAEAALRDLLHPDLWPHAGRSSFVTLLKEKSVPAPVALDEAVGLRLTFRQPPPIDCFSNQFLFYLNSTVSGRAYEAWACLGSATFGLFPPDRFHFEVLDIDRF